MKLLAELSMVFIPAILIFGTYWFVYGRFHEDEE